MEQAQQVEQTGSTAHTKSARRRSKKHKECHRQDTALALADQLAQKLHLDDADAPQHETETLVNTNNTNGLHNGLSEKEQPIGDVPERDRPSETLENGHVTLTLELQVEEDDIEFESYQSENQMAEIMRLIQKDLSEPYSIYTYRYFIYNWPKLCFLAMHRGQYVGAIVCKLDRHHIKVKRGYIAMLAVDEKYRKRRIGSRLVRKAITVMIENDADEVVLETEITNKPALRLYENLGFVRDKRLFRYYLNGVDALRLKLWLR